MLFAYVVRFAQTSGQRFVVISQFGNHIQRNCAGRACLSGLCSCRADYSEVSGRKSQGRSAQTTAAIIFDLSGLFNRILLSLFVGWPVLCVTLHSCDVFNRREASRSGPLLQDRRQKHRLLGFGDFTIQITGRLKIAEALGVS
jgi:hypothetical protein